MRQDTAITLFDDKQIRTHWDDDQEKWFFSVVDVVGVLTERPNPRKYWSVLKTRLKAEGSQLATNCSQLKMPSSDGKFPRLRGHAVCELQAIANAQNRHLAVRFA